MSMNDIIDIIANYGAMGVCLAYMIYSNNTTMKELKGAIDDMRLLIQKLIDDMEEIKRGA